jgi:hypothetical protein
MSVEFCVGIDAMKASEKLSVGLSTGAQLLGVSRESSS